MEQINRNHIQKMLTKISDLVYKQKHKGTTETKREKKLIVSLTTYPERINTVRHSLASLLTQNLKADEVILWLAEEQFLGKEKKLPSLLLKLQDNGLTIKWYHDIKSYKKLIPALKEYPDDIIVTADDDIFYQHNWLEKLYNAYLENPHFIHCHRAHQIKINENNELLPYKEWKWELENAKPSFLNFFTSGAGTLYPPHSLHKDVTNEKLFMKLSPYTDDVFFWVMALLNDTKINLIKDCDRFIIATTKNQSINTLAEYNWENGGNDKQIKNLLEHYPELKKKILSDDYKQLKNKEILMEKTIEKLHEEIQTLHNTMGHLRHEIMQVKIKLATEDNIYQINNIKFYLPNYPLDFIQSTLVNSGKFYEENVLIMLDEYIKDDAIILDIGANIGNHTLYWGMASPRNIKKIYSFEPIEKTFYTLKKNIEINKLEEKVKLFNIGLSAAEEKADIALYSIGNTGMTALKSDSSGTIPLKPLDSIIFDEKLPHIDFIKIDVEGFEINVLEGAKKTIMKYRPVIFLESFQEKVEKVKEIMKSYNYILSEKTSKGENYLFFPQ